MPQTYTVFDTETTGLIPKQGHRIVEIAAIKIINDQLTSENFVTLINPQRPISPGAAAVNGITDAMVADAPVIDDILPFFMEFIE